ncbi:MAG TPA: DUF1697 domain-containing protein [bacterium]|nr:DUF1697 domain-containing protein [bacterium]
MTKYVALIRALNVGGTSVIKMTDLKKMFESFGLDGVSTYIQSGNVIFQSGEKNQEKLKEKLEKGIKKAWGKDLKVFVFTSRQLQKAADHNPFEPSKHEKEQICHLMFLSGKPDSAHQKALLDQQGKEYKFAFWDKAFYYAYSKQWAGKRRTN